MLSSVASGTLCIIYFKEDLCWHLEFVARPPALFLKRRSSGPRQNLQSILARLYLLWLLKVDFTKDANLNFCCLGLFSWQQVFTFSIWRTQTCIKTTETNIREETVKRMITFRFLLVRATALRRYLSLLDLRNNDDFWPYESTNLSLSWINGSGPSNSVQ